MLRPPRNEEERVWLWKEAPWEERMIYEDGLPPPSEKVEVTTVVPVLAELDNNNVWRLMKSAAEQQADPETFELLLVVNNSAEDARKERPQFEENQRTVLVVRTLQKAIRAVRRGESPSHASREAIDELRESGIEVSPWQEAVFSAAVARGIRFYAVDASSEDRAPTEHCYNFNMAGLARHIGGRVAYRRFHGAGRIGKGLIDFIDGDCTFPPNYYQKLIAAQDDRPKQKAFIKDIEPYAPDIPEWGDLAPLGRLAHLFHFLRQNISQRKKVLLLDKDMKPLWGPAPVVDATLFRAAEGYPMQMTETGGGEDVAFSGHIEFLSLLRFQKPKPVRGTFVRLSDRYATSFSIFGSTWKKRRIIRGKMVRGTRAFAEYFDPRDLSRLEGDGTYRRFAIDVLSADRRLEEEEGYRALREKRWAEEVESSRKRVEALRSIVAAATAITKETRPRLETFTKGKNYRRWIQTHFGGLLDQKHLEYLSDNPIVMASIYTASKLMENEKDRAELGIEKHETLEEDVWSFFERYLPEYAAVLSVEEPDYGTALASVKETGRLPEGCSLRHLTHLIQAQRDWELESTK